MKGFYSHPRSVIILSQRHGVFLIPILVLSTEGNLPWHGDLRAETGIFYSQN